jgi:LmbE family N-acetylglucosaminyl deacetylase
MLAGLPISPAAAFSDNRDLPMQTPDAAPARRITLPAALSWLLALLILLAAPVAAQVVRPLTGASSVEQRIERLRVVGSLLYIGAHPDDENNRTLAYYAQGRKLRTGYLSLTRGEGGQNLIGGEQGALLGVIRTEELLMARRVDGASQSFSRAIDFGFSKTAAESMEKWGREETLSDIVWQIRQFRPDVIVLSFTGTPRDGHGHHQASAILAKEAFHAAADPKRFPEQLKYVQVWQAKRVLWNAYFGRARDVYPNAKEQTIDTGDYNAALGMSYSEIGAWSRTQHRSQAQGSPERKGSSPASLVTVEGPQFENDFLDGVDTTWNRLPNGAAVDAALVDALHAMACSDTAAAVPALLRARALVRAIDRAEAREKLVELDEAIAAALGLWLDVTVNRQEATPGSEVLLEMTAVNRSKVSVTLQSARVSGLAGAPSFGGLGALAFNTPLVASAKFVVPADARPTQPYWLERPEHDGRYEIADPQLLGRAENPPLLECLFEVQVGGETLALRRAVERRVTDRLRGDVLQPFVVVPPVSLSVPDRVLLFPDAHARTIDVGVTANADALSGVVGLTAPGGWRVEPATQPFSIATSGMQARLRFTVTPPLAASRGRIEAFAQIGATRVTQSIIRLDYEHIPRQTIQPPAAATAVRADVKIAARRIGYVMGAGDAIPDALEQLGCEVSLLSATDLAQADLSKYDAIIAGVRAWNLRDDLRATRERLWRYAEQGGTVVVQYNVLEGFNASPSRMDGIGPYPITISRDRVTVEESPVAILDAASPLLHFPNEITGADFDGWVQERGLYFPSEWDGRYQTVLASHDPGEKPLAGGILFARTGRGAYIYTSYSWFRQLPAGVSGAWRLFANLVSAGRAGR